MSQPRALPEKSLLEHVREPLTAEFKKLKLDKTPAATLEEAASICGLDTADGCFAKTPALCLILNTPHFYTNEQQLLRVGNFLLHCDAAKVSECDESFEGVCRRYASEMVNHGPAACTLAARSLRVAVTKRCGSSRQLSPVHTDLMQVLIVARLYSHAVRVADVDPIGLAPRRDGSTWNKSDIALSALRFFYYCGIAYAACRRSEDACRALLTGLSLPANSLGQVHVAMYKKYLLLSLLSRGKAEPLPRYVSSAVSRGLDHLTQQKREELHVYAALCKGFEEASADDLGTFDASAQAFAEDGNAGLVETVLQAYSRARVARLTAVYLTLSLDKIKSVANLPNTQAAEMLVLDMIKTKQIFAHIDQAHGVVHFISPNASGNLDGEAERLMQFGALLGQADDRLATQKSFVQRLVQRGGAAGNPGAALQEATDLAAAIALSQERDSNHGS